MEEEDGAIVIRDLKKVFFLPITDCDASDPRITTPLLSRHGKYLARFEALRGINLTVRRGECIGIIGDNGAGKSTLLKVIAGIYNPDGGRVKLNGHVLPILDIGVGFNIDMTGRENISLGASILGIPHKEIDNLSAEIINFSGLEAFMDTPLKFYSNGMKARLAFALAFSRLSDITLIDEVLTVGDESFQNKSFDKIKSLCHDENKTVVIVSHSLDKLKEVCDRVAVMVAGELVFVGSPPIGISVYLERLATSEQLRLKEKISHLKDAVRRCESREMELMESLSHNRNNLLGRWKQRRQEKTLATIKGEKCSAQKQLVEIISYQEKMTHGRLEHNYEEIRDIQRKMEMLQLEMSGQETLLTVSGQDSTRDSRLTEMMTRLAQLQDICFSLHRQSRDNLLLKISNVESEVDCREAIGALKNSIRELLNSSKDNAECLRYSLDYTCLIQRELTLKNTPSEYARLLEALLHSWKRSLGYTQLKEEISHFFREIMDFLYCELRRHSAAGRTDHIALLLDAISTTVEIIVHDCDSADIAYLKCQGLDRVFPYFHANPENIEGLAHNLREQLHRYDDRIVKLSCMMSERAGNGTDEELWKEERRLAQLKMQREHFLSLLRKLYPPLEKGTDPRQGWGHGDVIIRAVTLLDSEENPTTVVQTGLPLRVRIKFEARRSVSSPMFGIAIHTESGFHVCGMNTTRSGVEVGEVSGFGWINLVIQDLSLSGGRYLVTAAVYDTYGTKPFDHHHLAYPFEVVSEPQHAGQGLLDLPHAWMFERKKAERRQQLATTTGQ